jgi:para-nitrobenzyl esterase
VKGEVEITSGRVAGRLRDGTWVFAGIPYGGPTSGTMRWRPAQPPRPWSGTFEATSPGPVAPQSRPLPGMALPGEPTEQDENCLTLNVWTPGLDGGRRPVMVWLHGGGFTSGTGYGLLYFGDHLARGGDVVVVTLNYRLGALGFLAHPSLADPETGRVGNAGLTDQVLALSWVRDNIEAFGGDPSQVTVFGESAGAMSVSALMTSPAARGLFRRAIVQSGPPYTHSLERAEEGVEDLARRLGMSGVSRSAFEAVPADELVRVQRHMQAEDPRPGELPLPFLPTVEGIVLPEEPRRAVESGQARDFELVIGSNRDEMAFFGLSNPHFFQFDEPGLLGWLRRAAPQVDAEAAVSLYRETRAARGEPHSPWHLWVALGTDLVFRWPSVRFANAQRPHREDTFTYLFTWPTPAFGGVLGACHAVEIPFVFGCYAHEAVERFVGGLLPGADTLSRAMHGAWLSYARSGGPGIVAGSAWSRWDPATRPTMVFGDERAVESAGQVVPDPFGEELRIWSELLAGGSGDSASTRLSVPAGPAEGGPFKRGHDGGPPSPRGT